MKTPSAADTPGPTAPSLQELRASRGRPPSAWRRYRAWIIAGGVMVALLLFGFFGLPPIAKAQAIKQLSQRTGREVVIGKVRFNPLVLSATVNDFAMAEADPASGEFTGWRRLYVNFDAWSLFAGELSFQEIALDGFRARVALDKQGALNFADILAKVEVDAEGNMATGKLAPSGSERGTADVKPLALAISRLDVTDAQVTFNDASRTREFATVAGPLTFSLREFRTVGDPDAPYQFEVITSAGERLAWKGTVSADPLKSQGELVLANIDLARLSPYYHELVAGELRSAFADASGRYTFELRNGEPALTWDDGAFTLRDVRFGAPGAEADAFALGRLAVTGVAADSVSRSAAIGKVSVEGLRLRATRDTEGIDLLRLVTPRADLSPATSGAGMSASGASPAPALPKVTVGELTLSNVQLDLVDLTTPRRVEHRVENIQLTLRDLDSADLAKALPLALELTLPQEGRIAVSGTVAAQPLAAELDVALDRVPFANASPYLEPLLNIRLAGGTVRASGRATLSEGMAGFVGDFGIAGFKSVDSKLAQDFLTWTDFAVTGIRATTAPLAFHADEIRFVEPSAIVRIEADGSLNIASVAVARPAASASVSSAPASTAPLPLTVTVASFALDRAAFRFEDLSVRPVARVGLSDFTGKITGLSSEALGRADVDLRGLIDGVAPVAVTGKLNPLGTPAFMDLKLSFTGIDLQAGAGPYIGRFVGRELMRGSLDVAITAKLADRRVDTNNVVTLDQFYLGEKTDSPDATSLPVGLALALLRDTQGQIVVDLPIKGSLDDPEFKIGRAVMRVLTNILTRVATSPFSMLGAAFGGGGDELGWQDFAAGSKLEDEVGIKKTDTVEKALTARPALRLDLAGAYDPVRDLEVLRRERLDQSVRALVWVARRQGDPNTPSLDQIDITPEQRADMIGRLYAAAFPLAAGEASPRIVIGEGDALRTIPLVSGRPVALRSPFEPAEVISRRQVGRLPRFGGATLVPDAAPVLLAPELLPAPTPGAEEPAVPLLTLSEMEARLAQQIEIPEEDLQALGEARAQAIRARLLGTGKIAPERILLAPTKPTGTRIKLELK